MTDTGQDPMVGMVLQRPSWRLVSPREDELRHRLDVARQRLAVEQADVEWLSNELMKEENQSKFEAGWT